MIGIIDMKYVEPRGFIQCTLTCHEDGGFIRKIAFTVPLSDLQQSLMFFNAFGLKELNGQKLICLVEFNEDNSRVKLTSRIDREYVTSFEEVRI